MSYEPLIFSDANGKPAGEGKVFFQTVKDITAWLQGRTPEKRVVPEGSVGHWSFWIAGNEGQREIIGEAWLHQTKPGWWYQWNPKHYPWASEKWSAKKYREASTCDLMQNEHYRNWVENSLQFYERMILFRDNRKALEKSFWGKPNFRFKGNGYYSCWAVEHGRYVYVVLTAKTRGTKVEVVVEDSDHMPSAEDFIQFGRVLLDVARGKNFCGWERGSGVDVPEGHVRFQQHGRLYEVASGFFCKLCSGAGCKDCDKTGEEQVRLIMKKAGSLAERDG